MAWSEWQDGWWEDENWNTNYHEGQVDEDWVPGPIRGDEGEGLTSEEDSPELPQQALLQTDPDDVAWSNRSQHVAVEAKDPCHFVQTQFGGLGLPSQHGPDRKYGVPAPFTTFLQGRASWHRDPRVLEPLGGSAPGETARRRRDHTPMARQEPAQASVASSSVDTFGAVTIQEQALVLATRVCSVKWQWLLSFMVLSLYTIEVFLFLRMSYRFVMTFRYLQYSLEDHVRQRLSTLRALDSLLGDECSENHFSL